MRLEHILDPHNRPATNGSSQNGSSDHPNGSATNGVELETNGFHSNGDGVVHPHSTSSTFYGHDREQVTRILLQGLNDLGYRQTASQLGQESGYHLEIASVAAFRSAVQKGDWDEAETLLFGSPDDEVDGGVVLGNGVAHSSASSRRKARQSWESENGHSSLSRGGLPLAEGADIPSLKFLIRQQKYLELLERRELNAAMNVLRNELTPLKRDTGRIHALTRLLMCPSVDDLHAQSEWSGSHGSSRSQLLSEISKSISPSIMIPEHRLAAMFSMVQHEQTLSCRYHNTTARPSLYTDHECPAEAFPLQTAVELRHHDDEVWYLQFSHDGSMLATAGKDDMVYIYDTARWKLKRQFAEHVRPKIEEESKNDNRGICCIAFSPDDRYLISCSKSGEFVVVDVRDGQRVAIGNHFDYPVTSAAWLPDSQTFVIGTQSSQRPLGLYSMQSDTTSTGGVVRNNEIFSFRDPPWDVSAKEQPAAFRVTACAVSRDGRRMAATTVEKRLLVYDLSTRRKFADWALEDIPTSVAFAPDDDCEILVSMEQARVHSFSATSGETLMTYEGAFQKDFVLRSAYGGAEHHLIVSGSEDSTIHIWRRETGVTVATLDGHAPGTINAVAWHPTNPAMFASAGDDRRVRIWTSANALSSPDALTLPGIAYTAGSLGIDRPPLRPPPGSTNSLGAVPTTLNMQR